MKARSIQELTTKTKNEISASLIIGQYLSIKAEGNLNVALCPFHSANKPSLVIYDSLKSFKCSTCNATGDAISFVMKYRNLDLNEAIKEIASKFGIDENLNADKLNNTSSQLKKVQINRRFSESKWAIISKGIIPKSLDDRWSMSKTETCLVFKRTWQNNIIYKLYFSEVYSGEVYMYAVINEAEVSIEHLNENLHDDSLLREEINTMLDEIIDNEEYTR